MTCLVKPVCFTHKGFACFICFLLAEQSWNLTFQFQIFICCSNNLLSKSHFNIYKFKGKKHFLNEMCRAETLVLLVSLLVEPAEGEDVFGSIFVL